MAYLPSSLVRQSFLSHRYPASASGQEPASQVLGASDFLSPLTSAGFKPVTQRWKISCNKKRSTDNYSSVYFHSGLHYELCGIHWDTFLSSHAAFIHHLINTNLCPLCWASFSLMIYYPSPLYTDAFCSRLLIYEGQGLWASFHQFKALSSVSERYFLGTRQN